MDYRSCGTGANFSIGCAASGDVASLREQTVTVVEKKRVAGYDATVLTAVNGDDLVEWLKRNDYPYSDAMASWAAPYLGGNWHFTVLKLGTRKEHPTDHVKAAALRISFQTDQPLFPYREPVSREMTASLEAEERLLRIFFIAETQYEGRLGSARRWRGKTVWSGPVVEHRERLLKELGLPDSTLPKDWWLTTFEDKWAYDQSRGDVYFSAVKRLQEISKGISRAGDLTLLLLASAGVLSAFRKFGIPFFHAESPSGNQ